MLPQRDAVVLFLFCARGTLQGHFQACYPMIFTNCTFLQLQEPAEEQKKTEETTSDQFVQDAFCHVFLKPLEVQLSLVPVQPLADEGC